MLKNFSCIIGAALLASAMGATGAAQAHGSHSTHDKPAAKVKAKAKAKAAAKSVCPISHEEFTPTASNSVRFEGKTIFLCCPHCKSEFSAMSPAQKKAVLAVAKSKRSS